MVLPPLWLLDWSGLSWRTTRIRSPAIGTHFSSDSGICTENRDFGKDYAGMDGRKEDGSFRRWMGLNWGCRRLQGHSYLRIWKLSRCGWRRRRWRILRCRWNRTAKTTWTWNYAGDKIGRHIMTYLNLFGLIIVFVCFSSGSKTISFYGWTVQNVFCAKYFLVQVISLKGDTLQAGMSSPDPEENKYTTRDVELWRCSRCNRIEKFPRYNDPIKLLSSRRGRCGEFANVSFPRKSTYTVFCVAGAGNWSRHSMGLECWGSCLGGILLYATSTMDTSWSLWGCLW